MADEECRKNLYCSRNAAGIKAYNDKKPEIIVSASYGYSRSSEFEKPQVSEVYTAADKRMYAMKEEYYKTMGYSRRRYDD